MRIRAVVLALAPVCAASLAFAPAGAVAACPNDALALTALPAAAARGVVLCSVNAERAARGLRTVVPEAHLQRAAQAQGVDMVARRFFEHTSPDGRTLTVRVRAAGYLQRTTSWSIGEALGWAPQSIATAAELTRAWIESAPHRAILLGGYREVGIGIVAGVPDPSGEPGATAVLDFGRRTMRRRVTGWASRSACARTARRSLRTRARCTSTTRRSKP
jgi:Cysteine-rich secretory protein family